MKDRHANPHAVMSSATRDTGDWLPNVHKCPHRMVPCGNASCADEAMRGAETNAKGIGSFAVSESLRHAIDIAKSCASRDVPCPMAELLDQDPVTAVHDFIDYQMIRNEKRI